MKKSNVRLHPVGSAEYVVTHARWQRSRGRKPSVSFIHLRDPRKALKFAERMAYFPQTESGLYLDGKTPANYKCAHCGATGCKLWRDYQVPVDHQRLLCLFCACKDQGEVLTPTEDGAALYTGQSYHLYRTLDMQPDWWQGYDPAEGLPQEAIETRVDRERTDQIGWMVPAVPTEDGASFWGYTSVPQPGCAWWTNLPILQARA